VALKRLIQKPSSYLSDSFSSTTAALSVILLRGVGWSTSRGPNVGYSAAFLGSQKGALRLLNRLLDLSAAVVLEKLFGKTD
jgi:hypothetical protein